MNLRDLELTLPPELRWENLTLANDFLFGKIMHDPQLCTEMIRRILPNMDIGHIEFTQPQKSAKYSLDTRGVRFDVFARSDSRKLFDCEVQTSDKKDLPRRTRAYHSVMGLEALEKHTLRTSGSYNDMPDAFVIFICMFDPFGLGRHIYTFRNSCKEVNGLYLDDGAVTIFLNAHGKSDDISGELKAFLDFMLGKPGGDPFIKKLSEQMKIAKLNAKWRRVYMLNLLHDNEVRSEGIAIGKQLGEQLGEQRGSQKMMNIMLELMRKTGISPEQINAVKAELSEQQIQALLSSSID